MDTTKKTIILFSGDFDRVMAAFIIANGAAAVGADVTMFFTFWGLNVLRRPEKVKTDGKKSTLQTMLGKMMPNGAGRRPLHDELRRYGRPAHEEGDEAGERHVARGAHRLRPGAGREVHRLHSPWTSWASTRRSSSTAWSSPASGPISERPARPTSTCSSRPHRTSCTTAAILARRIAAVA